MRGLMMIENGFEDTEALLVRDLLSRAGIRVLTCSLDSLEVNSQYNLCVKTDILLEKVIVDDYDFLVIPGGRAVKGVLDKSLLVDELIKRFYEKHKLISAICAGPSILGRLGLLKGREYICFPGYESDSYEGFLSNECVVESKNIITAKSMYYSFDFALMIISNLLGEEKKDKVFYSLKGE